MNSIQRTARMAGFLYLFFIVTQIMASLIQSKVIVVGDVAATAKQIVAHAWLFWIGFISDLLATISFGRMGAVGFIAEVSLSLWLLVQGVTVSNERSGYIGVA